MVPGLALSWSAAGVWGEGVAQDRPGLVRTVMLRPRSPEAAGCPQVNSAATGRFVVWAKQ